ncbi:MAG: glutathione S-transferase family protein [Methanobacteriota archaeon]
MLLLYDMAYSPTCAKVRKIMDYKGVPYRAVPVPYHDKVRLLKETGQDYVPFLRNGPDRVPYVEAVDYLERVRPEPSAYPDGTREVCRILESWEYDWFEDRVWALVAPYLERRFADPVERWNFTEYWERVYGPFDAAREAPRPLWRTLDPSFAMLEDCLRRRDWLVTTVPTAFDFAIYGDVFAMDYAGLRVPTKYPRLRAWYGRARRIRPR